MVYAYDKWEGLPVMLLYDTDIMKMSIAAAKDMYEKGLQLIKDFSTTYGDFITPIQKDLDWYNLNVTGKFRRAIDDLYAKGIDPIRSAEGRMLLSRIVNSVDVGQVAKLRSSAKNAEDFLKARRQLEAAGLYNPLLAKYDGPDMGQYSTLDQGVWDKMSPTPYHNMADFTKSYFDNIQPFERAASKNGISYSISEISPKDLQNIAEAHYNDLVSTPQGQLMYRMYRDQLGSDEAAKKAFNDAVVAGNLDRLRYSDNYNEMQLKNENLRLQRSSNALAWLKFYWDKDKEQQELDIKRAAAENTPEKDLDGFSLAQRWFDKAEANAWSVNGITKQWKDMKTSYGEFGKNVDKLFHDFGQNVIKSSKSGVFNENLYNKDLRKAYNDANASGKYTSGQLRDGNYPKPSRDDLKYYSGNSYKSRIKKYENAFLFDMDPTSVARAIGGPNGTVSGNGRVVQATAADILKIYAVNDYVSNTAGFTAQHVDTDTKNIRNEIERNGASNVTITPLGKGYGSLRKIGANFEVAPKIRVAITDKDTGEVRSYDAYYDLGLRSASTRGGAYVGNYAETGGFKPVGSMTSPMPKFGIGDMEYKGPVNIGAIGTLTFIPGTSNSTREFNMYPDYNQWSSYGNWDTRESHALAAGASKKLATY